MSQVKIEREEPQPKVLPIKRATLKATYCPDKFWVHAFMVTPRHVRVGYSGYHDAFDAKPADLREFAKALLEMADQAEGKAAAEPVVNRPVPTVAKLELGADLTYDGEKFIMFGGHEKLQTSYWARGCPETIKFLEDALAIARVKAAERAAR